MKPDRLLDLFCELARIESPSRREAVMAKRCKAELEGLGFTVRFDDSAERTGSDTGNLIALRAGIVPAAMASAETPRSGSTPACADFPRKVAVNVQWHGAWLMMVPGSPSASNT